jgi:MerR family transcriptional regulator, heat shock protein HspR
MGVGRLDDEDYPAVTMGQAAELLEVQPAFLRSLDAAGVLTPSRSSGGHRRYSRRQLALAARMRELFDEGMTLDAAARIVGLQDELATARARIDELEAQHGVLRGPDTPLHASIHPSFEWRCARTAPSGWSIEIKCISLGSRPIVIKGEAPTGITVSFTPRLVSLADSWLAYQVPSPSLLGVAAVHVPAWRGSVNFSALAQKRWSARRVPTG